MESATFEIKSSFGGLPREWLRLVKTVVAMANTSGGKICIEKLEGLTLKDLDPARLDDKVNKHVAPRIDGLEVHDNVEAEGTVYAVCVEVPDSIRTHVIVQEGQYEDGKGNHKREFHRGQIWTRHSAQNAPCTPDDLETLVRKKAATLLETLGAFVQKNPTDILETAAEGSIALYPSDQPGAIPAQFVYPYLATTLGEHVGKDPQWVAKAANALGWRDGLRPNPVYSQAIRNGRGDAVVQWRYSDRALHELQDLLATDAYYDPRRPKPLASNGDQDRPQ